MNNEGLENVAVYSNENPQLNTTDSVARKMTEGAVENVDTEK